MLSLNPAQQKHRPCCAACTKSKHLHVVPIVENGQMAGMLFACQDHQHLIPGADFTLDWESGREVDTDQPSLDEELGIEEPEEDEEPDVDLEPDENAPW